MNLAIYRSVLLLFTLLIMPACTAVNTEDNPDAEQSVTGSLDFDSGVPFIAPEGVTLQPLGKGQGYKLGGQAAQVIPRNEIAYADLNLSLIHI